MNELQAVSGFREDEVVLFERKLRTLILQQEPAAQERRFDRIVAVAGLPSLESDWSTTTIDVPQLMRLRESDDWKEFRDWLRRIDTESDEEIAAQFSNLRESIASIAETGPAKLIRFIVPVLASFVPAVGLAAGPGLSAIDAFVVNRILGKPGPVTFISRSYPSIFHEDG